MKKEEALGILKGYREARREYKRLLLLLEEVETRIEGLSAIDYSATKVQSTPNTDKLAATIDKLNDIRNQCIDKAYETTIKMRQALDLISTMTDSVTRDAFTRYYIRDHSWERVAYEMGYSFRGIMHIRAVGLNEVIKKSA